MSFNFITDPDTLMTYSIFSEKGLSMLKKYVRQYQEGGEVSKETAKAARALIDTIKMSPEEELNFIKDRLCKEEKQEEEENNEGEEEEEEEEEEEKGDDDGAGEGGEGDDEDDEDNTTTTESYEANDLDSEGPAGDRAAGAGAGAEEEAAGDRAAGAEEGEE